MPESEVDLCLAKVTIRTAEGGFDHLDALDVPACKQLCAAVAEDLPLWVETELRGDDTRLYDQPLQPWGVLNRPVVRLERLRPLLDCLSEPDGGAWHRRPTLARLLRPASSPRSIPRPVLERLFGTLPRLDDYGAPRLVAEIARDDWEARNLLVLPLVVFVPLHHEDGALVPATDAAENTSPAKPVRCAELRLGLALARNLVVTVRLPDRRCPPAAADDRDATPVRRAATVRIRNQHLTKRSVEIDGVEITTAIMRYCTATCTAVVRHIQEELTTVERGVLADEQRSGGGFDPSVPSREIHHLGELADHMQRDLSRTLRRMPDHEQRTTRDLGGHELLVQRTVLRVRDALAELQSVQTELQLAAGTMTNLVAARQLAASQKQQTLLQKQLEEAENLRQVEAGQQAKTDEFHRLAGTLGALVVVPALLAALWGANTWLPGEQEVAGFLGLLLLMISGGLVSWQLLETRWERQQAEAIEESGGERPPTSRPWRFRRYQAALAVTVLAVGLMAVADDGPDRGGVADRGTPAGAER